MELVPTHPRRVAITSACPSCGGDGWIGTAYGRPCGRCRGNGTCKGTHETFERMKLDTSVRRAT